MNWIESVEYLVDASNISWCVSYPQASVHPSRNFDLSCKVQESQSHIIELRKLLDNVCNCLMKAHTSIATYLSFLFVSHLFHYIIHTNCKCVLRRRNDNMIIDGDLRRAWENRLFYTLSYHISAWLRQVKRETLKLLSQQLICPSRTGIVWLTNNIPTRRIMTRTPRCSLFNEHL
jgi:hypothetical protein